MLPILYNKELTPQSSRSTKEMGLSIYPFQGNNATQTYSTGDHLVVYPENQPDVVRKYIEALDLSPLQAHAPSGSSASALASEEFVINKVGPSATCIPAPSCGPISLALALTHFADLQTPPTPKTIRTLAGFCESDVDQKILKDIAEGDVYRKEVLGSPRSLLDVMNMTPSLRLPVTRFLELTPQLRPRYYSISSSSLVIQAIVAYRSYFYFSLNMVNNIFCVYMLILTVIWHLLLRGGAAVINTICYSVLLIPFSFLFSLSIYFFHE